MIQSAIAGNEVLAQSVSRQPIFLGLGLVLMLIITAIDYHLCLWTGKIWISALAGYRRYSYSAVRNCENNNDHGFGGLFCQEPG